MHGFSDVVLGWKGEEYTVPANKILMLAALVEDKITSTINERGEEVSTGEQALTVLMRRQGPPHLRMARTYGAALRFAGCNVSDDEIYLSMQEQLSTGSAEGVSYIQSAVINLIAIVSPPLGSALLSVTEKKSQPVKSKKKGAAES